MFSWKLGSLPWGSGQSTARPFLTTGTASECWVTRCKNCMSTSPEAWKASKTGTCWPTLWKEKRVALVDLSCQIHQTGIPAETITSVSVNASKHDPSYAERPDTPVKTAVYDRLNSAWDRPWEHVQREVLSETVHNGQRCACTECPASHDNFLEGGVQTW